MHSLTHLHTFEAHAVKLLVVCHAGEHLLLNRRGPELCVEGTEAKGNRKKGEGVSIGKG